MSGRGRGRGRGRSRNNYASIDRSGINSVSGDEQPIARSTLDSSRPIRGAEFFKGFQVSRPTLHLQLDSKAEASSTEMDSWTEQTPRPKVEAKPFVFEKPETDFHLQVTKDLLEEREERKRNLLTNDRGVPIHDCTWDHRSDEMCQFCDGRRGSWAQPNARSTTQFKKYQEAVLSSPEEVCTDVAAKDPEAAEDSYYEDFGVFDAQFF